MLNINDILSPAFSWIRPEYNNILNNNNIVFVNSSTYQTTMNELSQKKDKFIVICTTGDPTITNVNIPKNIIKFYSTNLNIYNEKAQAIPCGILDLHANILSNIKVRNNKQQLVYCNFDTNTHTSRKQKISYSNKYRKTKPGNKQELIKNLQLFFEECNESKYTFCPRGNGIDTYRMWECLYLGSIPIVEKSAFIKYFIGKIPMLEVDNIKDVNDNLLLKSYEKIISKEYTYNILTKSYWINNILENLR